MSRSILFAQYRLPLFLPRKLSKTSTGNYGGSGLNQITRASYVSWAYRCVFFCASVFFSIDSKLYIGKAPLHIGVIVHQIYKYIEVASLFKEGPYLQQKTTTT